ncbi:hypothetical protein B296_00043785 [Ensete ventricosum]|uniref:F-box associated domain-containing protein n=1 Tax=Ensete ventricosum TaxID=4639 RepID=A0A426ZDB3_ENSVE|nr:hypothetical protein B296_00043785 [Ensete ventricosum]
MVFVAGKHDKRKNALWFTLAYDATSDTWVHLADMAWEHDKCHDFTRDTLCVLDGFLTIAQAQFSRNMEAFDVAAWRWCDMEEGKLAKPGHRCTCMVDGDKRICMC